MIKFICGRNNTGKTQKLVDAANEDERKSQGALVYIDRSDKRRLMVDSQIKFINTSELGINSAEAFYGLLCGILSGNYDIAKIFIDDIQEITGLMQDDEFDRFVICMDGLAEKFQAEILLTLTTENENYIYSAR